MPAYKYSSNNSYDPFIQALVKPKMGKNYTYNGRLYSQVKRQGKISYADAVYNLSIRLMDWASNSIDIELEIKNFTVKEEHDLDIGQCNAIVNSILSLEGRPIYMRVCNKGRIQKIFNVSDLASVCSEGIEYESQIIDYLESNPLISSFLCGHIEEGERTEKIFTSNIFPSLRISSELKVESKKERFNNATETNIADKKILFDRHHQENIAQELFGHKISKDNIYDFNTLVTSRKGVDRVLAYSTVYSTEETLGADESVYISVGMEKVVQEQDVNMSTKLYSSLLKNISMLF